MFSSFTISLVVLISVLNYIWHSNQIIRQTINQTQQIIDLTSLNIDNYIDELYRLTLSPYYNNEIMSTISESSGSSINALYKKRTIENFLSSVMTLPRNEVLRVYILTDSDIYSYIRTPYEMEDYLTYKNSEWYQQARSTTKPVFIPVHYEKVYGEQKNQIFSIARCIRSKEDNKIVLGVVRVDADYSGIKSICDKVLFEEKGALFVIDNKQNIVYQNNGLDNWDFINELSFPISNGDFITTLAGEKYIVNINTLEESGLQIIAINSYANLTKTARKNLGLISILVLLCILFSFIVLKLFIQHFFHPLFHIIDIMKQVQTGDLSVQVPIKSNDEIGYLAKSFNSMIYNLNQVMKRNTELATEVYTARYLHKASQYDALCSQIKPHFIHNTLNTISLLIKCGEPEKAVASIENLSHFLRGVMNTDKEISLQSELQLVSSYLQLQQIRYGEKLTYSISENVLFSSIFLPALTLQPIVENAIKHNCDVVRTPVHITISAIVITNAIQISISDNGIGIPESYQALLLANFEHSSSSDDLTLDPLSTKIGLVNVYTRLKFKFGDSATFTIRSAEGIGTTVILTIPYQETSQTT